jgi:hypothetical protein
MLCEHRILITRHLLAEAVAAEVVEAVQHHLDLLLDLKLYQVILTAAVYVYTAVYVCTVVYM